MDEQRENMQNGMIENETTGEQKPDGGKERRRRGMGAGILLGICGTLVVGALGIYLTCRFTGSQILITNAAADTDGTTLLDAKTTAKINELSAYVDLYYYEDTDVQDLKDGLYAGLLEGLDDRYSVYYTADEYAQTQVSMTGQYYGIGAGLAQDKDTMQVTITKVYEGTPSESAGLRNEDVILSVDGTEADTMDVTDLVKLIRGEAGTTVHLEIYRPSTGENLSFDVERADVTLPSVSSQMLNDTIGYIRIESFEKDTANQFEKALAELEGEGLTSLVVDLRYNGGGLVDSVVQILDDILPEGLIVYTEDKNGHREEYRSSGDTHFDYDGGVNQSGQRQRFRDFCRSHQGLQLRNADRNDDIRQGHRAEPVPVGRRRRHQADNREIFYAEPATISTVSESIRTLNWNMSISTRTESSMRSSTIIRCRRQSKC